MLQLLLDHGFGVDEEEISQALVEACGSHNIEAVQILLNLNILRLSRWMESEKALATLLHDAPVALQIFDLLLNHGLSVDFLRYSGELISDLYVSGQVECLNAVLRAMKKRPRANTISDAFRQIFDRSECTYTDPDETLRMIDTLATLRAAGFKMERLFVKVTSKRSDFFTHHIRVLLGSGVDVNATEGDSRPIYQVIKNNYDTMLIARMLQAGASFDPDKLIELAPRDAEVEDVINYFSTTKLHL
jgi:hypothetical protein